MEYLGILFSIGLFIFSALGYLPPAVMIFSFIAFLTCVYKLVDDTNKRTMQEYNPSFWDGILLADVLDSDWLGDSE